MREITKEYLEQLSQQSIYDVDPDSLDDIADIIIDEECSVSSRVQAYVQSVKNPYVYKTNGAIVKISFAGTQRLEDIITDLVRPSSSLTISKSISTCSEKQKASQYNKVRVHRKYLDIINNRKSA